MSKLITGLASAIITPPLGIALGGNGRADNKARGVHDDLRVNVLTLDNGETRLAFVSLDLLGILYEDCEAIRKEAEKRTGIPAQHIIIFATHTHSGPNAVKIFMTDPQESEQMDEWRKVLVDKVVSAIGQACDSAFPGRLSFLRTKEPRFSFNRRVITADGSLKMVFEEYDRSRIRGVTGPNGFDDVNSFLVADSFNRLKGIFVNYTTHAACVCGEDWLYSRDYIHYLATDLQAEYGKDFIVLFANGSEGNMVWCNPEEPFITGFGEAERVGKGLAETLIQAIRRQKPTFSDELEINIAARRIRLPLRLITPEQKAEAERMASTPADKVLMHGLDPRIGAIDLLKLAGWNQNEEETLIQAVRIGRDLAVTLPGEVFIELALDILRRIPANRIDHTVLLGLANDFKGYIPTEEAFAQGGYEIKTALSSRLAPKAGQLLVDEIVSLASNLIEGASSCQIN